MKNRTGFLHLLRRERSALSTLAAAAMLARVLVGVLGLVMAPSGALAAAPGFIICSGATGGSQPIKGAPWAALQCPCAACHHAGGALACAPSRADALLPIPDTTHAVRLAIPDDCGHVAQRSGDPTRIRAPPSNA